MAAAAAFAGKIKHAFGAEGSVAENDTVHVVVEAAPIVILPV